MNDFNDQSLVLAPLEVGPYRLANRMVMAPMTRNRAGDGNAPTDMMVEYYRQRASAGLIVTEATQVSEQGVGYANTPGIHTDAQVAGWKKVTEAVHAAEGRIFLQLWHVGRISHPSMQPGGGLPVAPSAILPAGEIHTSTGLQPFVTPRALETAEVTRIVADFAAGARRAMEAGFDGVAVHAANGYLVDQFLRDGTNLRTDRYGGSIENRTRFLREVVEAVICVWGPERVGVRLSPKSSFNDMADSDPDATFTAAAEVLGDLGIAYLHIIEPLPATERENGEEDPVVGHMRDAFAGILVLNNGYDHRTAEMAASADRADLVAFGRPWLANPDLAYRFARGLPLNQPIPATFYGGDEVGYTDYPEWRLAERPAAKAG